ncbi:uncharacterized protein LOC127010338 [Eriocheir sinensis]|uniref:uncharacterized protein LOC127010338 n=1 Tax=Eriocheir sinensis TaxID=95602 RepID=UPI0021C7D1BD|nr:uncharacterized protein LOC127010338 [Eriocheir sinensis]
MVMVEQHAEPAVVGGDLEGKYKFLQLHFHWGKVTTEGSEHTIDGKRFPGEVHLVHFKEKYGTVAEASNFEDGIAVLGVMLESSVEDNPDLNPIIENLVKIRKAETETEIHPFALQSLLPRNTEAFFRYHGSLTTPTCNEIVVWTVFRDTIRISAKQLAQFRTLTDDHGNLLVENFRPLQPLNGREVEIGRARAYWSYIPPFDPYNWPKNYPTCGSKKRQSPVPLETKSAVGEFPRLTLGFKNYDVVPKAQTLINTGEVAQVLTIFSEGVVASIQGGDLEGKYRLLQYHIHWGGLSSVGSEHTIDGKRFSAELHLVHYKASYGTVAEAIKFPNGIAVLGIMLEISKEDNPKLAPIIEKLSEVHEAKEEVEIHPFPLKNLLPANTDSFFRYEGSLTTPTCDEVVIWTVFKTPITISEKQLNELRMLRNEAGQILQNNFRPLQPLSGREVEIQSLKRHWSYVGETGPEHWAEIYPTCKGNRQSPVNLVTSIAVKQQFASFSFENYEATPTTMKIANNGHTAQVMAESTKPGMIIGGGLEKYTFLQFHFHWGADNSKGSEHTIDGKRYPAELHMVHYRTSYGSVAEAANHPDGIAVLGIMLEKTHEDNPKFKNIIEGLAKVVEPETEGEIEPFPLHNLLPANTRNFFRYEGSLTTPTCNEIVLWTVFKEPVKLSEKQLEEFRKLKDESGLPLVNNFRPVQDLAGRTLYMT